MRCPHCQAPLQEQSPCCPQCHFDLEEAGRRFGLSPQLFAPLSDLAGALTRRQHRSVGAALSAFSHRFPQSVLHVILVKLGKEQNLRDIAFWLFNRGNLCAAMESAGSCHDALLLLDVQNHRVACVIGYGLEPFLSDEAVTGIARAALPGLQDGQCVEAIHAAQAAAEKAFAAACEAVPRSFGLQAHDIHEISAHDPSFAY
jgi:uncharacterized membrane protein YgcG